DGEALPSEADFSRTGSCFARSRRIHERAAGSRPPPRKAAWDEEARFFDAVARQHRGSVGPIDPLTLARYGAARLRRRFARALRFATVGSLAQRTIVDVGCGEGQDTVLLARLGARHVTGIDLSPGAIELARPPAPLNGVAD